MYAFTTTIIRRAVCALAIAGPAVVVAAGRVPEPEPAASAAAHIEVPGTSATIRMLLDMQAPQAPAGPAASDASRRVARPAKPAPLPPPRADDAPVVGPAHEEVFVEATRPPEPMDEATLPGHATAAAEPEATSGGPRVARDAAPSAVRNFIAYLREHRTEVFVSGLLALTLAAVGTGLSARRAGGRRRRLTATKTAGRRRRPSARRI